jgi:hypothetical protein
MKTSEMSLCDVCRNRFYLRYRLLNNTTGNTMDDVQEDIFCIILKHHGAINIMDQMVTECSFYQNKKDYERQLEVSTLRKLSQ